jgi:branched-chain amino acid transport system permease protein
MDAGFVLVSLLNGLSLGLLLFMLASGLTLIFSMMGVLNFAHASFYMLGAYLGYSISQGLGFWWALGLAPLLVGALGALFQRLVLRPVQAHGQTHGHMPELLVTFGLSYLIFELVQLLWGRQALDFQPPPALQGALFTVLSLPAEGGRTLQLAWGAQPALCSPLAEALCTQFPAFRAFGMGLALLVLLALWAGLRFSRTGLVIQAALTHPQMVQALGHPLPRVHGLVFAAGTALAALAGVISGALRVTEPSMAAAVGALVFAVIVIGGLGSLAGAFVAALALGLIDSFAVGSRHSLLDLLAALGLPLGPQSPGYALWRIQLSQVAAVLPYLLLVLVLVFRPRGLFGTRDA